MSTHTVAREREMTSMYELLAFEDAAGFERSALQAAAVAGTAGLCAGAAAGRALLDPRAALALPSLLALSPLLALLGAGTALLLGVQRRGRAHEAGEPVPTRRLLLTAVVLAALAGVFGARALPQLWSALVTLSEALPLLSLFPGLLRAALAAGVCGAAFGLWLGVSLLPLHLTLRTSPVERRLLALRFTLGAELRPLAERLAAAHRGAVEALRTHREAWGDGANTAPPLRTTLDRLALAGREQCARAAGLGAFPGATSGATTGLPPIEQILARQAELQKNAAAARDPRAKAALERAAVAQGQAAERAARLVFARERLLARLHEQVAELEGARLSLLLLEGAQAARTDSGVELGVELGVHPELELLDLRLQAGCLEVDPTFESTFEVARQANPALDTKASTG